MITIKYIRDYILDNNVTEHHAVVMNPADFDDIAWEYRETYGSDIELPFYLITVLVEARRQVPLGRLFVVKNDNSLDDELESDTVYRCGWCGNVVDADGAELSYDEKITDISIVQKFGEGVCSLVYGYCCKDGPAIEELE